MNRRAIRYGLGLAVSLIIFFLIMHVLGWSDKAYLRGLNGLIHGTFIYIGIKSFFDSKEKDTFNYLSGTTQGMYISIIGVPIFAIFMLLFLIFQPDLMATLKENFSLGKHLNPVTAAVGLIMEGIAVGLIFSYIVTRFLEFRKVGT